MSLKSQDAGVGSEQDAQASDVKLPDTSNVSHLKSNFTRRKSDYLIMLVILYVAFLIARRQFPEYSSIDDRAEFMKIYDIFNIRDKNIFGLGDRAVWIGWWLISSLAMHGITWSMFSLFRASKPEVHSINIFLLVLISILCYIVFIEFDL